MAKFGRKTEFRRLCPKKETLGASAMDRDGHQGIARYLRPASAPGI